MSDTWHDDNSNRSSSRRRNLWPVGRHLLFRILPQIRGPVQERQQQVCEQEMSEMICRHVKLQVVFRHVLLRQRQSGVKDENVQPESENKKF